VTVEANRVASRTGTIECFSIDLVPRQTVGRTGKGERQFIRPMGLGWDPGHRELYVADTGNDRIVRLAADGRFIAQYGGFGLALGDSSEEREDSLSAPWDVAPGGFSNFYVADQNNDRVCEFDAYKSYKGLFYPKEGDTRNRLNRPRGLTIDHENNLWVVDSRNDRVLKLSPSGSQLLELGGYGSSRWNFRDPTQVAVDQEGRIYVSDPGHRRISVFDRLGSFQRVITDHLRSPVGVGIDPDGLIGICDEETNELGFYTPDGRRVLFCAGFSERDRFRAPADLVVTPRTVYLLDSGNHRVVLLERRKSMLESSWQAGTSVLK
jgi:DNA-binding beta-propeller fold protein YncE